MSADREFLFVCVENAGRSQMAEAFFCKYAPDGFRASSAGTRPSSEVNQVVADAMAEVGIEIRGRKPKQITIEMLDSATPVSMGCIESDACPAAFFDDMINWDIPDPKGKTISEVREIRSMIESKVMEFIEDLVKS